MAVRAVSALSRVTTFSLHNPNLKRFAFLSPKKSSIRRSTNARVFSRTLSVSPPEQQTSLASSSNGDLEPYLSCSIPNKRLKVAVLLSGGVDSSVALRLLHAAGHACTAFYLKIWFQVRFLYLQSVSTEDYLYSARLLNGNCLASTTGRISLYFLDQLLCWFWDILFLGRLWKLLVRVPMGRRLEACRGRLRSGFYLSYLEIFIFNFPNMTFIEDQKNGVTLEETFFWIALQCLWLDFWVLRGLQLFWEPSLSFIHNYSSICMAVDLSLTCSCVQEKV